MSIFERTYGIEIECLGPVGMTTDDHSIVDHIKAAGIDCVWVSHSNAHSVLRTWKVTTDGSIDGDFSNNRGREIVSPPLRGQDGFVQIETICRVLKEKGYVVNKKCGLHVHVDARSPEFGVPAMKRLAKLYAESESIIDLLLPPSRRASTNFYCRSIASINPTAIDRATDATSIARAIGIAAGWSAGDRTQRYVKLNYASYWRQGTIEFRHHAGTLEAIKIRNWTLACLRMMHSASIEQTVTTPATVQQVRNVQRAVRNGTKRAIVYDMLLRPEGCTLEEVLAATGWQQASVAGIAHAYGMSVRTRREHARNQLIHKKVTRYWGTLNEVSTESAPAPAELRQVQLQKPNTVEEFADRIGMTDEEKQFWYERAMLFAAPAAMISRNATQHEDYEGVIEARRQDQADERLLRELRSN